MSSACAQLVARCVERVIGGNVQVTVDTPLFELDGFTSLAVVALVEELEDRLGHEIPPELIAPETFTSPTAIAAAIGGTPLEVPVP